MEELTDIIINCNLEDIKSQVFPKDKRFGLIVKINNVKYEFLITLKSSSDSLFIGASSALPRSYSRDRSKPYFERWSWDYDISTIFFNDPTLYLNENLIGGWGVGTTNDWYLKNISKIIEYFVDAVNISHDKIMIYGSSAGGFMALALSILIKDSTAVADIPQTILYSEPEKELYRWHWKELVKYCFDNLPEEYIVENFKHRLDILELIKKENYIPNAYLLCDCSVEKDFARYYIPFFVLLDELPFENNSNYIKLVIMGNNKGHARLDKKENINLVNIINGVIDNKSRNLVDKIYQMPVSEAFYVLDRVKYDTGIKGTSTDIYDKRDVNSLLTRTSEYSKLTEVNSEKIATLKVSSLPPSCIIDFEICQVDGDHTDGIIGLYYDNAYKTQFRLDRLGYDSSVVGTWLSLRLTFDEGFATLTSLNDNTKTRNQTFTGFVNQIRFLTMNTTTEIRLKNVEVKSKNRFENKSHQTPQVQSKNISNNANSPIKTFYCLGSCATRDVFNSVINPNYKQFFRVTGTGSQLSLISLMNENSFNYTDEDINANELTSFQIAVLEKELKKTGRKELIDLDYDYLIIDNYFEMKFGVCMTQDKIITNNYWNLPNTPLFESLENKKFLTVQSNPVEYYKLWCENCDLFFKFLNEFKPDVKVILNPVRNSTSFIDLDGSVVNVKGGLYKRLILENIYIQMFDEYILNNFDVDVLIFDKVHKADKNHPWNFNYVHYESSYYQEFNKKLNLIIERDALMDYKSPLSQSIRESNKKLFLNDNKNYTFNKQLK